MISPKQQTLLDNIIVVSRHIIILQTLKAGYNTELECDNKQEVKNFRSGVLIELARSLLEGLEPFVEYLANLEEEYQNSQNSQNSKSFNNKDLIHIKQLLKDLDIYYTWATEEIKIKNMRAKLYNEEFSN